MHPEYQYLNLLKDILENGQEKSVFGTETKIKSVFGRQIRFDLSEGFPLLTTKKVFLRGIIHELLWFLRGDSNVKYLIDNNVHIWDDWAHKGYKQAMEKESKPVLSQEEFINRIKEDPDFAERWGELGPIYGRQWRRWQAEGDREIDQIAWVIAKLKKTPERKSILVSAWNPEYIYEMALPGKSMAIPPCHTIFQPCVLNNKLNLQLYQRSADMFLGVPFNIASYALLTLMLAQVTDIQPGEFIHTFGDAHVYGNHFDQVKEQVSRSPRPFPAMKLNPEIKNINDFKYEDFTLENYNPYPTLKGEITVVGGF